MARRKLRSARLVSQKPRPAGSEAKLRRAIKSALREIAPPEPIDDAQSAAGFLQRLLNTGDLRGYELPAETLAEIFDVHRNTMTKALNLLVAKGYLNRRRGRPARVVSDRAELPERQARMISFSDVAERQTLEISTDPVRHERVTLEAVYSERRGRVARHLRLKDDDELIIYSRIRRLRGESTAWNWVPALAETAYFAVKQLPTFVSRDLEAGGIESIARYFKTNQIEIVNSDYRIRVAELPAPFHAEWARYSDKLVDDVKRLRFLRFESTTHFPKGPVEYSIAYLAEELFALSTTNVDLEIRVDALVRRPHRRVARRER